VDKNANNRRDFRVNSDQKRPDIGLKETKIAGQHTIKCSITATKTVIDDEISRGNRFAGSIQQGGAEILLIFDNAA
jgi:hypothetical protein